MLAAVLLVANLAVRYVGLLVVLVFARTLTIFLTTPAVPYGNAGFPVLSLAGQFLLKDVVLAAAALMVVTQDRARAEVRAHRAPQTPWQRAARR